MVADRRLTRVAADGKKVEVVDDDAAKVVLLGQQVAVGYTGLANVRPPPRGQTDWWLMDALPLPGRRSTTPLSSSSRLAGSRGAVPV